jgi:urease accessory protein
MKGSLSFTAGKKNGTTRLVKSFFTPPFNLATISVKGAKVLQLMVRSSSPGILDGDEYQVEIRLLEGAQAELSTQSFQRLFDMKAGAIQTTRINLAADASLEYIAHPSVPHRNSIFRASTQVELDESSKLYYGEIFTCGRALNGEAFLFTLYQSRLEIRINGKLQLKENLRIVPFESIAQATGMLENHTHQAALTCIDNPLELSELENLIPAILKNAQDLTWGMSRPAKNILVLRLLGFNAYKLHDLLLEVAAAKKKLLTKS